MAIVREKERQRIAEDWYTLTFSTSMHFEFMFATSVREYSMRCFPAGLLAYFFFYRIHSFRIQSCTDDVHICHLYVRRVELYAMICLPLPAKRCTNRTNRTEWNDYNNNNYILLNRERRSNFELCTSKKRRERRGKKTTTTATTENEWIKWIKKKCLLPSFQCSMFMHHSVHNIFYSITSIFSIYDSLSRSFHGITQ